MYWVAAGSVDIHDATATKVPITIAVHLYTRDVRNRPTAQGARGGSTALACPNKHKAAVCFRDRSERR